MSPRDQAGELWTLAQKDYKAATILAYADEPQIEAAGFHLQQAVEKALKGWLTLLEVSFPRTHDLSLLLGLLEDAGHDIDSYWELLELNPFAVQFRYEIPGDGFPEFEQSAQKVKQRLEHVQTLTS
ncbi:HEPN domain-containing protein [Planctomycetota bacterium]